MKFQSKLLVLIAGVSLIIISACNKGNSLVSPQSSKTNAATSSDAAKKQDVTITGVYDFSTFPDVWGTFTTTGALNISGSTEMVVGPKHNGVAHCVVVLYATDGTITIKQECEFHTAIPKGQWQIVSGTGAYENLKGNGSLLMPPDTEAMTGVIY